MRTIAALCLLATPAIAEDWVLRATDQLLDADALATRLIGQNIVFYDNGRSEYFEDGSYAYTYDGGGTAHGDFTIRDDSTVCVNFDNGWARCDLFVVADQRLVVITEEGERFPIRP